MLTFIQQNAHFPTTKLKANFLTTKTLCTYNKTLTFLQQKCSLSYNKNPHFPTKKNQFTTTKTLTSKYKKEHLHFLSRNIKCSLSFTKNPMRKFLLQHSLFFNKRSISEKTVLKRALS